MILDIETTETHANVLNDLVRTVFTLLDRPAFWLLGVVYEIFFNVATAELFTNATIKNFYSRVQIILGVFMVFRLSITVLQTLIDPEKVSDKNEGFTAVIKRVVIGLLKSIIASYLGLNDSNKLLYPKWKYPKDFK